MGTKVWKDNCKSDQSTTEQQPASTCDSQPVHTVYCVQCKELSVQGTRSHQTADRNRVSIVYYVQDQFSTCLEGTRSHRTAGRNLNPGVLGQDSGTPGYSGMDPLLANMYNFMALLLFCKASLRMTQFKSFLFCVSVLCIDL